eukprot:4714988-Amphidinium_carterae.2
MGWEAAATSPTSHATTPACTLGNSTFSLALQHVQCASDGGVPERAFGERIHGKLNKSARDLDPKAQEGLLLGYECAATHRGGHSRQFYVKCEDIDTHKLEEHRSGTLDSVTGGDAYRRSNESSSQSEPEFADPDVEPTYKHGHKSRWDLDKDKGGAGQDAKKRFVCSCLVFRDIEARKKERQRLIPVLTAWDVSRAHLYRVVKREVYCTLPEEDEEENKVALLWKSLYGLQDASTMWQSDWGQTLLDVGFRAMAALSWSQINGQCAILVIKELGIDAKPCKGRDTPIVKWTPQEAEAAESFGRQPDASSHHCTGGLRSRRMSTTLNYREVVTQDGTSTLRCQSTWQSTVSLSTAENEYCAIVRGIAQMIYCVSLAKDFEIPLQPEASGCAASKIEVSPSNNSAASLLVLRCARR